MAAVDMAARRQWVSALIARFDAEVSARLNLVERAGVVGAGVLRESGSDRLVGRVAVLDAPGLQAAVLTEVDTSVVRLHQMVLFTPPTSPLPHLSFEASANPGGCWLSVDLVPTVTPLEEPRWTAAVYEPLSTVVWDLHSRSDLRQSLIRPRHRLRLSPWLASVQLEEATGVPAAADALAAFVARFADLIQHGLPADALPASSPAELADRDFRERAQLYSWDATANYRFLDEVAGEGTAEAVQGLLRDPSTPG